MPYMLYFQGVVLLMSNIVSPLFSSIADALEAIILTLHNEDFSLWVAPAAETPAEGSQNQYCDLGLLEKLLSGYIILQK